uniref:Uncharacterized protein n=1 Tax=Magnetococcus massalia (strain MO-1) TaxID=451514 RepID=A0A1S7LIA6_MAGMO|nr:protein of unknown function [Candidatus Magnetococcus massalia]
MVSVEDDPVTELMVYKSFVADRFEVLAEVESGLQGVELYTTLTPRCGKIACWREQLKWRR